MTDLEMFKEVESHLNTKGTSFAKIEVDTGISCRTLYNIKNGKSVPHKSTIINLYRYFKGKRK